MNGIETLLDRPIFQALGWTLIHFIWQGALIAILYAAASVMLRRFTASLRYAAACGAMLLMLIAPLITISLMSADTGQSQPGTRIGEQIAVQTSDENSAVPVNQLAQAQSQTEIVPESQSGAIKRWARERLPRGMPWLLALWFAGVLLLSLRFAGGLLMVQRLKRVESSEGVQFWQERLALLCHRLRVSRPVRLCESTLVEIPTVVGWLRPVILFPATALTGLNTEQLEALLAHELGHIRRYDYLANLLQTAIETLFFYHPAVWWVSAQVRQEREHCCDDLAVAACGDVLTYARALTALEQLRGYEPQFAVAASGGSLLVRIQRLLRGRAPAFYGFESGPAGFIALATVFILLAGAQAALLSRNAKAAAVRGVSVLTLSDSPTTDATANPAPASSVEHLATEKGRPVAEARVEEGSDLQQLDLTARETAAQDSLSDSDGFKSEMAAAGLTNLSPDQLTAFKIHGVTPQFVREMAAVVSRQPGADEVIAMRIHGVTPAYANGFKEMGLDRLNADQLIAFAIHGVTPQFVTELRAAGCTKTDPDSLIAFRIHGITPAFVQQMKDIGFVNLSGDQLNALAIHGVTPLFVQTMKTFIRGRLSSDDLIGLRIHGVTPEMIKALEIMGYANLTAEQLMALAIHGVTPAFIRSIQDAGYDRVTVDQLTELRICGVTAEFIQTVKSRGFPDVTLHQLAELRRLNILPSAKKN
jgi:beta-lactamase regulating signal transducer with metallopeptidase domain